MFPFHLFHCFFSKQTAYSFANNVTIISKYYYYRKKFDKTNKSTDVNLLKSRVRRECSDLIFNPICNFIPESY